MKKRFLKLLCVFMISILAFGKVSALSDTIKLGTKTLENTTTTENKKSQFFDDAGDVVNFHFKVVSGDNSAYAFCLDSNLRFDESSSVAYKVNKNIFSSERAKIEQIILKAYLAGLNTNSNSFNLTNDDFYAVTQMAIWNAAHGSDFGGLRSETYKNWLNGDSNRKEAYDYLNSSDSATISKPTIDVSGNNKLTKTSDEKYFESEIYTVTVSDKLGYTVRVDGDSACVLKDENCLPSQKFTDSGSFKIRVTAPTTGNGSVKVAVNIQSDKYVSGYDFALYAPEGKDPATGKDLQNAAVFKPKYDSVKKTINLSADYINESDSDIEVQKLNKNGNKVAGAVIGIYGSDDKLIDKVTSTGADESNKKVTLSTGKYYIKEISAPKGYILNDEKVEFSISKDGSLLDKNDKVISVKTLSITDDNYLDVSKTDATGQNEIKGAKLVLKDISGKEIESWESDENSHRIVGLEIGSIYEIVETLAPEGFAPLKTSIYFVLNDNGTVTTCNIKVDGDKKSCEAMSTEDILKIKNDVTKVKISKKDFTTGEEINGAHLQIIDENGKVVEEWTSGENGEKDHYIEKLAIGKYTLVETIYPENYMETMIIDGAKTTSYEFEITDGELVKIDVYNELNPTETIDVPNTGISTTGLYIMGSVVVSFGVGTILIARKKENLC